MRRRARARALQALYAWDIAGTGPLLATTERLWDDMALGVEEREFAAPLMQLVAANRESIDAQLADVTTNWRLERLGAIERSILRLGAAEFARLEVPGRVTIQESVRLAELFGSDESAKFVNGVLDALARRLGRL